ncbi:hypothetical protein [Streptomyces wuyuanensis]|uniref:hypothetical protein n=1 Tax=Streptomyces wuyuanensis TaxID=1196353 RepID=UPI0037A20446
MVTVRPGPRPTGEPFRSDRYFEVWQYSVGHGRLLLRSTRDRPPATASSTRRPTRIEVHFTGVGLMLLGPAYEGLVVRSATDEESSTVLRDRGIELEECQYVFALADDPSMGFGVSAPPQGHEDGGGVDDPSWFGHMVGTG